MWTSGGHLVDAVANDEHVETFVFLLATLFLHERDDDSPSVVFVSLVGIHHLDDVLRVRAECV